jgi:hypothetical protein
MYTLEENIDAVIIPEKMFEKSLAMVKFRGTKTPMSGGQGQGWDKGTNLFG